MNKLIFNIIFIFSITFCIQANEIEILADIPGSGIEIKNHFKVTVNYRGTLENGKEFDSSYKRKEPFVFQIGLRQVIPGWEIGLMGMQIGGKRTFKIPPNLGYGSKGTGKLIPSNATLIFEVEIVDIQPPGYKIIYASNLLDKQKEGFVVIDIRTKKEWETSGTINGSIKMTAFDIKGNFNPIFLKTFQSTVIKEDKVIFVSNKGEISAILANGFVEQLGVKNMYSLSGGIQNWIEQGFETIK